MSYADRLKTIEPFHVMRLLAEAQELQAQGREVIHMEVGEPDFPTPPEIVAAGRKALAEGKTFYTPALGLPALREAIAEYYQLRYKINISPGRVVVTPGASGALFLLMALLVNAGDQVLMTDPGYPCNRNFVCSFGGQAAEMPTAKYGFNVTADLVSAYWLSGQSRAVLLTTPSNPTGGVIDIKTLQEIHAFVQAQAGYLIVDEIYQGLTYDQSDFTAAGLDDVFIVNSFSKYFGMTGWRLGWMIAPESAIPELDKLAQNLFLAASTPAQYAALSAFSETTLVLLEERKEAFRQRRDFLLPALQELGFEFPVEPRGAFYLFADCSALSDDSEKFSRELLHKTGVCVTPGLDFCVDHAERYLRFAYTTELNQLKLGVSKIHDYIKS